MDACTTTGEIVLGIICFATIFHFGVPMVSAAWMNLRSLSEIA